MLNTLIFLALRVLHVLCAAVWIGSTAFMAFMLVPAVEGSGASGGQVMARMDGRGFHAFMGTLAGTTVLTGIYLIWRFAGGFGTGTFATHAGLAFGIGGTAGVLALVIGGAIVGRNAKQVVQMMAAATAMPDGLTKGSLIQQAVDARRRMKIGSKVVIALQATALVLMTVAHYV